MNYFFPSIMYERAVQALKENVDNRDQGLSVTDQIFMAGIDHQFGLDKNTYKKCDDARTDAKAALDEFNFQIKRYFGLGFVTSFIPFLNTESFRARKNLSDKIDELIKLSNQTISLRLRVSKLQKWSQKIALSGIFLNIVMLGPLWNALNEIKSLIYSKFQPVRVDFNYKSSIKRIISYIPPFKYIYHLDLDRMVNYYSSYNIINNIIHAILNPIIIVEDFLFLIETVLYRLIEIGSDKGRPSDKIRFGLKLIVYSIFLVAYVPLQIIKTITDIPYLILRNMIYSPLNFIFCAVMQSIKMANLETIRMNEKEFDVNINKLRAYETKIVNKQTAFLMGLHQRAGAKSSVKILQDDFLADTKNMVNMIFEYAYGKPENELKTNSEIPIIERTEKNINSESDYETIAKDSKGEEFLAITHSTARFFKKCLSERNETTVVSESSCSSTTSMNTKSDYSSLSSDGSLEEDDEDDDIDFRVR